MIKENELRACWRPTLQEFLDEGRTVFVDKDPFSKTLYIYFTPSKTTAFIIKPKKKP